MNSIPVGAFSRFVWHREGRYLLRLTRIDVLMKREALAVANYSYILEIERHTGYTLVTINLFGKSWLINIGKRQFYVERINQETE